MANESHSTNHMLWIFAQLLAACLKKIPVAFAALFIILVSHATYACQGEDYQQTLQYIEYSQSIGYQCGLSINPVACMLQEFPKIIEEMQKLSPSCQQMLQQMYPPTAPGSGGPMCHGGVCCDSSGCYGP
jgi:hypothetical protein